MVAKVLGICLIFFHAILIAQNSTNEDIFINGKIIDLETTQPLPYVSIGVMNKSQGTLTDSVGNFRFKIFQENLNDSLNISMIGFYSKKISVKEFINSKDFTIQLSAKSIELAEVVIWDAKVNTEIIGRQGSGKLVQVSIHNKKSVEETIGSEMGMRYKTKHPNAILKDFNFYLSANNFKYIKYRLNIYTVKDNMPDTLLYNKQILFTVENYKTGWTNVYLEPYRINVNQDFIITIQWVESSMDKVENPITLVPVAITLFSKYCYARVASQDKWKKMGMNLSNYITLKY